ncbi:MAG: DUF2330 domain-containing protein [Actinomycetota bacterium]|nr:DUF2330 domain-containing protein [Actinomycetota bacterium]
MRTPALHRAAVTAFAIVLTVLLPAGTALACGGLVAPNGTISLTRTTTLAAYHDGVEHYVTSFEFAGASAGEVGSIVPLPGVPIRVIKGGDWTLQRLVLETQPQERAVAFEAAGTASPSADAVVILEKQIDALDITVLKGGAFSVGDWAREHGFFLPPDAPEVLQFYASRSPYFMAARFDAAAAAARGIGEGEGTPIHLVIPTDNPWVPLRILGLGRDPADRVQADVFLLTDHEAAVLPQAGEPSRFLADQTGLIREVSEPASDQLITDLRSDRGMAWMPDDFWLTYLRVNAPAGELTYDLAIDGSGAGLPDPAATGLGSGAVDNGGPLPTFALVAILLTVLVAIAVAVETDRGRSGHGPAV